MIQKQNKPIVEDVKANNGEHSHFRLINVEDGSVLWEESNCTTCKWNDDCDGAFTPESDNCDEYTNCDED